MAGVDGAHSRSSEGRPAWIDRAVPLHDVVFDAAFVIRRAFYLAGDFTGATPLPVPRLPLIAVSPYVGFALTRDIEGSEQELIGHYQGVFRLCASHALKQRFAVTAIVYDGGEHVACLDRPSRVIPALLAPKDGRLFFDGDQGYEVEVFAFGDRVYLHDYDPDESEEFSTVSFAREPFQVQVTETARRLEKLMRRLTEEFGRGVWNW